MNEDLSIRKTENIRVPNLDVAVPLQLKRATGSKGMH